MNSEDQTSEVTKLEKFLKKEGRAELIVEIRGLDREALRQRLASQAIYRQETIEARRIDETLSSTKLRARELGAPYRESLKINEKISQFVATVLKEKDNE